MRCHTGGQLSALRLDCYPSPFAVLCLTFSAELRLCRWAADKNTVPKSAVSMDAISRATLCRSLLPSSLLTSNRACLLPGSSTLVPWLLHAGYHIPQTNETFFSDSCPRASSGRCSGWGRGEIGMGATADRPIDRAATPGILGLHSRRRGTAALCSRTTKFSVTLEKSLLTMRSESRRLYAVDYAKSECSARAPAEECDPPTVRDSRPLARIARPTPMPGAVLMLGRRQRACSTCLAGWRREWCGGRKGTDRHCECAAAPELNLVLT